VGTARGAVQAPRNSGAPNWKRERNSTFVPPAGRPPSAVLLRRTGGRGSRNAGQRDVPTKVRFIGKQQENFMKALVKKERKPGLWLEDVPQPTVGINDVLIRVDRTGIIGVIVISLIDEMTIYA
jgi:hypothetical protein